MEIKGFTPKALQWQQQMAAAAPKWAAIRQQMDQSAAVKQDRLSRLWEGFSTGDVVILGPAKTQESYGLNLCDDSGESILMDGVLMAIEGEFARIRVGRHQGKAAPGRGPMVGEPHLIKRSDIVRVSDKPPKLWGDAKSAMG